MPHTMGGRSVTTGCTEGVDLHHNIRVPCVIIVTSITWRHPKVLMCMATSSDIKCFGYEGNIISDPHDEMVCGVAFSSTVI